MKILKAVCLIMISAFLMAGCQTQNRVENQTAAAQGQLLLTGSSTIAPVIKEIAKKFQEKNPGVKIEVQTGGSGKGISDTRGGLNNIGMVSRALNDKEQDLVAFSIGRDGVCFLINKDNPVQSLSDEQLLDIFTGKIKNWQKVGGKDAPITVINRTEGRSEIELVSNYFKIKPEDIKSSSLAGDNKEGLKAIADNPAAIIYISIGNAEAEMKNGAPIKMLPISGIAASVENVRNGTYPITRPLLLITKTEPDGATKAFIEFARSKDVAEIISNSSYVPMR